MAGSPSDPLLASLAVFDGVPPELLEPATRREFRAGDALVVSGAPSDSLLVVVRGHVGIWEGSVRIATRQAVTVIGEMGVIDGRTRSATAIADDAVVAYAFDEKAAGRLLDNNAFCRNLLREINAKLREATADRAYRYRSEELLFGAFRSHVSAEILNELLESGEDGRPRQVEVVVLFADIRGFTSKMLGMSPDEIAADLSEFIELAVAVVHRYGGMVDKFIGDSVMALWGYTPSDENPASAFRAAVELATEARQLSWGGERMRIGVGIESGIATLGVIGNAGKRQFTALGPPVNLAARLQAVTKSVRGTVCIGPDLVERLPDELRRDLEGPVVQELSGVGNVDVWIANPMDPESGDASG